jgi:hypothetical protein
MIDATELAICRNRGHDGYSTKDWQRCKWCGLWFREVRKLEEREDDPPDGERDPREQLKKLG